MGNARPVYRVSPRHLGSWQWQACFPSVCEEVAGDEARMEGWGPDHGKPAKAFEFYLKGIK